MIRYYQIEGQICVSQMEIPAGLGISETAAQNKDGVIFFLYQLDPGLSRRSFALTDSSLQSLQAEGISLLMAEDGPKLPLPIWLAEKMAAGQVTALNMAHPHWWERLTEQAPKKWRVHLAGLGDVGGTLLTGLRLLGGEDIAGIGIFDLDTSKMKRWECEINQIRAPFSSQFYPDVYPITASEMFDCDLFVFCVSVGVPPVGEEGKDVRLVQLAGNGKIVSSYASQARQAGFAGIFAVVSDPVDLLCRMAFDASNQDENKQTDYRGLAPEQIRGYGLGVMNARAVYYARQDQALAHYEQNGRAFGPHGQGLVIADSIAHYRDDLSRALTTKVEQANLAVRSMGYKPYVAPALSSGALSLLATIRGEWHYSATFMGGVFMGAKNRLTTAGVEIERLELPADLQLRLEESYEKLRRHFQ